MELHLLRIVQEALTNVRKHARAQHVSIQLHQTGGSLRIVVADDGVGFDPAVLRQRAASTFGVAMMHERAAAIGGELSIAAAPNQGTRVTIRIPADATVHRGARGSHARADR